MSDDRRADCPHCGYRLGKSSADVCPECGFSGRAVQPVLGPGTARVARLVLALSLLPWILVPGAVVLLAGMQPIGPVSTTTIIAAIIGPACVLHMSGLILVVGLLLEGLRFRGGRSPSDRRALSHAIALIVMQWSAVGTLLIVVL